MPQTEVMRQPLLFGTINEAASILGLSRGALLRDLHMLGHLPIDRPRYRWGDHRGRRVFLLRRDEVRSARLSGNLAAVAVEARATSLRARRAVRHLVRDADQAVPRRYRRPGLVLALTSSRLLPVGEDRDGFYVRQGDLDDLFDHVQALPRLERQRFNNAVAGIRPASRSERAAIVARPCALCRRNFNIVCDHIKPVARGGTDALENLQPLCFECNAHKAAREDILPPRSPNAQISAGSERPEMSVS